MTEEAEQLVVRKVSCKGQPLFHVLARYSAGCIDGRNSLSSVKQVYLLEDCISEEFISGI